MVGKSLLIYISLAFGFYGKNNVVYKDSARLVFGNQLLEINLKIKNLLLQYLFTIFVKAVLVIISRKIFLGCDYMLTCDNNNSLFNSLFNGK